MATLGISTNTRLLGMAIIHRDKLVDYKIHLHKLPWSASKAQKIITRLEPCVRRYCIKKIALSIPHEYHQTNAYKLLMEEICTHFKEAGISIVREAPSALYALCQAGQKKTKKALMSSLATRFPEIRYCYHKELRNKTKYYIKLFEAVAVAILQELSL
jgi:hypothetical protein